MKFSNYPIDIELGDRIYFKTDKAPFKVKAISDRYIIATKPFNPQRTVLYTIIDMHDAWRGPNDMVFNGHDYAVQEDIDRSLTELISGEIGVSRRHGLALGPDMRVEKAKKASKP